MFMPKLAEETVEYLAKVTVEDVTRTIDELSPDKTPGPHGLFAAFYKTFEEDVSPLLCRVYVESHQNDVLPPSFLESYIMLIPKSEGDAKLSEISRYCPIRLTNVDYKILMKVLASPCRLCSKTWLGRTKLVE